MREIKFRGMDIESNAFIIGNIIKRENHFTWIYPNNQETLSFTNLIQVSNDSINNSESNSLRGFNNSFHKKNVCDASLFSLSTYIKRKLYDIDSMKNNFMVPKVFVPISKRFK